MGGDLPGVAGHVAIEARQQRHAEQIGQLEVRAGPPATFESARDLRRRRVIGQRTHGCARISSASPENTTSNPITFGEFAENEMCFFGAYCFPSVGAKSVL